MVQAHSVHTVQDAAHPSLCPVLHARHFPSSLQLLAYSLTQMKTTRGRKWHSQWPGVRWDWCCPPPRTSADAAGFAPASWTPRSAATAQSSAHFRPSASAKWLCECCGQHSRYAPFHPAFAPSYKDVHNKREGEDYNNNNNNNNNYYYVLLLNNNNNNYNLSTLILAIIFRKNTSPFTCLSFPFHRQCFIGSQMSSPISKLAVCTAPKIWILSLCDKQAKQQRHTCIAFLAFLPFQSCGHKKNINLKFLKPIKTTMM